MSFCQVGMGLRSETRRRRSASGKNPLTRLSGRLTRIRFSGEDRALPDSDLSPALPGTPARRLGGFRVSGASFFSEISREIKSLTPGICACAAIRATGRGRAAAVAPGRFSQIFPRVGSATPFPVCWWKPPAPPAKRTAPPTTLSLSLTAFLICLRFLFRFRMGFGSLPHPEAKRLLFTRR